MAAKKKTAEKSPAKKTTQTKTPAELQTLFSDSRKDVFEGSQFPDDLTSAFGEQAPHFSSSAEMMSPDGESKTMWSMLAKIEVLDAAEVAACRKRYIPICVSDDKELDPYFDALLVDTSKAQLPVVMIGVETGCQFKEIAPSLKAFRARLKPREKEESAAEKTTKYLESLRATCFVKRDYKAALKLASQGFHDEATCYEALRVEGYALLQLKQIDKANQTYRVLHKSYALLPNSPIASARADLESVDLPAAKEILKWLGSVPIVGSAEITAHREWWQSIEIPLKEALANELSGRTPKSLDHVTAGGAIEDGHLAAIFLLTRVRVGGSAGMQIDLSPLARLSEMEDLILQGPGFQWNTLSKIAHLRQLTLSAFGDLKDLGFLRSMPDLERLTLSGGDLTDLSALESTPRLKWLQASGPTLGDLTFLRGKPSLDYLLIRVADDVTDFAPLAELTTLRKFVLYSNGVTSFDFLSRCERLEDIEVSSRIAGRGNLALRDLHGLANKPLLTAVTIRNATELRDISALRNAPALARVELDGCSALEDFTPLTGLPLKTLGLGACTKLHDLACIARSPSLTEVEIYETSVTDLSPLAACRALKKLVCWGMTTSPVLGMEHVLALPTLEELSLQEKNFPDDMAKLLRKKYRHLMSTD